MGASSNNEPGEPISRDGPFEGRFGARTSGSGVGVITPPLSPSVDVSERRRRPEFDLLLDECRQAAEMIEHNGASTTKTLTVGHDPFEANLEIQFTNRRNARHRPRLTPSVVMLPACAPAALPLP